MSKICQITGTRRMVGNKVSHSNIKTKRIFNPNLQKKRFYWEEEKIWVTLKVTPKGMKTINKIGLEKAIKRAAIKGFLD
jgi:large subunit ribosomal protein L28